MCVCICFPTWPFARDLSHGCHGNPSTSTSLRFFCPFLTSNCLPSPQYGCLDTGYPWLFKGGHPISGSHSKLPGPFTHPITTSTTNTHAHTLHTMSSQPHMPVTPHSPSTSSTHKAYTFISYVHQVTQHMKSQHIKPKTPSARHTA